MRSDASRSEPDEDRGFERLEGSDARQYVAEGARATADVVRPTFGPGGLSTVVETADRHGDGTETVIADDAAAAFDAIRQNDAFVHPVAAWLADSVDAVQRRLGDGTTTAVLVADALIRRGRALVDDGLHPSTVAVGYALAASRAGEVLDSLSQPCGDDRERLRRVARTAMTGDLRERTRRTYARMVVEAAGQLSETSDDGWVDTSAVKIIARRGEDAACYDGIVVQRRPDLIDESERAHSEFDPTPAIPEPITDPRVAVLDRAPDPGRTATNFGTDDDTGVRLDTGTAAESYADGRAAAVEREVSRLADLGLDILAVQEEVDDVVRATCEDRGIVVLDGIKTPLADVYRLARATDGQAVSALDAVSSDTVGTAESVVEERHGEEKWAVFEGCRGTDWTIVVDAALAREADRVERLVSGALEATATATMDRQVLPGAGSAPLAVAQELRRYAPSVADREQLAVEAFADAAEELVETLVRNAGHDPVATLAALRRAHDGATRTPASIGVDWRTGEPVDAWSEGVLEPRRTFSQALESGRSVAEELLTVEHVFFPTEPP